MAAVCLLITVADFDYLFENTFQTRVMITISYRDVFFSPRSLPLSRSARLGGVSFIWNVLARTFVWIRTHMSTRRKRRLLCKRVCVADVLLQECVFDANRKMTEADWENLERLVLS